METKQPRLAAFEGLIETLHDHMRMRPDADLPLPLPHVQWVHTYRAVLGYLELYELVPHDDLFRAATRAVLRYLTWAPEVEQLGHKTRATIETWSRCVSRLRRGDFRCSTS